MFTAPTRRQWGLTVAVFIGFAISASLFGLGTGLYTYAPLADSKALLSRSMIAFIAPALLEELAFRGPLLWLALKRGKAPVWAIALSLALFILWHPFNAMINLTEMRGLFFDWRFLTVATGLGAGASFLALRTRSIWPPIAFHWVGVVGWIAFLGAPNIF